MLELVLEKIIFARSEDYDELFFFTCFSHDKEGKEYKIQGISTPELNMVGVIHYILF